MRILITATVALLTLPIAGSANGAAAHTPPPPGRTAPTIPGESVEKHPAPKPTASNLAQRKAAAQAACRQPLSRSNPRPVPPELMPACLRRGMHVAVVLDGGGGTTFIVPAGPVLVRECRTSYIGEQLAECLNRPQEYP